MIPVTFSNGIGNAFSTIRFEILVHIKNGKNLDFSKSLNIASATSLANNKKKIRYSSIQTSTLA